MEDAKEYTQPYQLERLIKNQSGHVLVPISLIDKPDGETRSGRRQRPVGAFENRGKAGGIHRLL